MLKVDAGAFSLAPNLRVIALAKEFGIEYASLDGVIPREAINPVTLNAVDGLVRKMLRRTIDSWDTVSVAPGDSPTLRIVTGSSALAFITMAA